MAVTGSTAEAPGRTAGASRQTVAAHSPAGPGGGLSASRNEETIITSPTQKVKGTALIAEERERLRREPRRAPDERDAIDEATGLSPRPMREAWVFPA